MFEWLRYWRMMVVPALVMLTLPGVALAQSEDPAPTAGVGVDAGQLRFEIVDEAGNPMPGRLTFIGDGGVLAELFPNVNVLPDDLAVRSNVIYSLSGSGFVTVPPGVYTVYASHGLEWSIDSREIVFVAGDVKTWTARLRHEVDTTGWVSGDFHLHTLTYSGHGDANMKERVISLIGEGVEFAVATDHNHHTDYDPTIAELGAGDHVSATTGNEVSTPIGHFNAFPLNPESAPVDSGVRDADSLFKLIREQENRFGITPVIQVNHPRWLGIDYFSQTGLDPVAGIGSRPNFSAEFDTVEVLNEPPGWGYYDAEIEQDVDTASELHSVLQDWFNLLNLGYRPAAVGNSDSHSVANAYAGFPRNFMPSPTDDPGAIDPADVAASLKGGHVFTTLGPFVEFSVEGESMGGDVAARDGAVELSIRVQAASWIDCDRVKIVFNGEVIETIDVPETRTPLRLEVTRELQIPHDGWLTLLVEGDDPLTPIVHGTRPVRPIAIANPVWIDADGDGSWASPATRAVDVVRGGGAGLFEGGRLDAMSVTDHALVLLALAAMEPEAAIDAVGAGLLDDRRQVRLAAARAAERLAVSAMLPALETAMRRGDTDKYLGAALLRAQHACGTGEFEPYLLGYLEQFGTEALRRYKSELAPLLPGRFVDTWLVLGYFPNPQEKTLVEVDYGPEHDPDPDRSYAGAGDVAVKWTERSARSSGYLNLLGLDGAVGGEGKAIAYAQVWLHSPDQRQVRYTFGSDDGSRIYLNDALVHEDNTRHGADPLQKIDQFELRPGWNRLLIKVENGGGDFGLYLRILDDAITWSPSNPEG